MNPPPLSRFPTAVMVGKTLVRSELVFSLSFSPFYQEVPQPEYCVANEAHDV